MGRQIKNNKYKVLFMDQNLDSISYQLHSFGKVY